MDWSKIGESVVKALSSMKLWIAIIESILIIALGYVLGKTKFMPENFDKILSKFVMFICLPCLIFCSFMSIKIENFGSKAFAFGYGFIIYTLMVLLSRVAFLWIRDKSLRKVFGIMFVFGSTNFFGQPLIRAVFGDEAFGLSNIYNVANLIYVFSYAYFTICIDKKDEIQKEATTIESAAVVQTTTTAIKPKVNAKFIVKKIFTNPIIIATLIGFILWALQLAVPANSRIIVDLGQGNGAAPFWNIKASCPPLFETLNVVGSLSSPLIWVAIGITLGKVSIRKAANGKMVWLYSCLKVIIAPLINFGLLYLIHLIPFFKPYVTFNLVASSTIMWATPTATAIVTYCLMANKKGEFASSGYLISTIIAVAFIPILMVVLSVMQNIQVFAV